MNPKTFTHRTHARLEQATGLRLKRTHVYELMASALGANSYASLMSHGLLCALPSKLLIRKYAQLETAAVAARAAELGYPSAQSASIAKEMCAALQEGSLGLVPMETIVKVLLTGTSHLYEREDQDDDTLNNLDEDGREDFLDRPESAALELDGDGVVQGLQSAAARGDGRAHLAMALLDNLVIDEGDDFDGPKGSDGIYWYERRQKGHALSGAEKEWADAYEAKSQRTDQMSLRSMSMRQHLEKAAQLGQYDALVLMADMFDDDRFFDLVNPIVRADPRWIASLAERLGRCECAAGWLSLAAEQGSIDSMRDLIEQHDRDNPLRCWTWFALAQHYGKDLTKADYHAIDENGDAYDDDAGGPLYADGHDGVELPEADETTRHRAQAIAKDLFDRHARAIREGKFDA
jgi:hypothetical protein